VKVITVLWYIAVSEMGSGDGPVAEATQGSDVTEQWCWRGDSRGQLCWRGDTKE